MGLRLSQQAAWLDGDPLALRRQDAELRRLPRPREWPVPHGTGEVVTATLVEPGTMLPAPRGEATTQLAQTMQILSAAVEAGKSGAEITQIVELVRSIRADEARSAFTKSLITVQRECSIIANDSRGQVVKGNAVQFSWEYASIEQIMLVVGPKIRAAGFAVSWTSPDAVPVGYVGAICTLMHESGHSHSSGPFIVPADSPNASMSGANKYSGALTTCQRRTLALVLGIVTGDADPEVSNRAICSPEQVVELRNLAAQAGVSDEKLAARAGVKKVEDIRVPQFGTLVGLLKGVIAQKQEAARAEKKDAE